MLFALLAHDACFGLPTNVPSATGARRAVTLGSLTPPNGWKERANREEEQP
jgi:1,6-anhydro-N-acetylmuramate kinase